MRYAEKYAAELLSADWGTVPPVAVQTVSPGLLDTATTNNRFKLPKHVNRSCVSSSPRALRLLKKHATRKVSVATPPPPPPGRPSKHTNWCDRVLPTAARRGASVAVGKLAAKREVFHLWFQHFLHSWQRIACGKVQRIPRTASSERRACC